MIEAKGRALLFDIDGTLADTDALHREAFERVFGPRGHVVDDARFKRELQGFSNASIGERFLPLETLESRAAIMNEKEEIFRDLVAGRIEPLRGLMALLDQADAAGIPMVAVTNAPRLNAELLLSGLGITHRFKAIVIGDELPHGKPHPLPYLEGLRFVGAKRANLDRVRGLPLRRAIGRRGRHSDHRHAHDPWPRRPRCRRRDRVRERLRRSGSARAPRRRHDLVGMTW